MEGVKSRPNIRAQTPEYNILIPRCPRALPFRNPNAIVVCCGLFPALPVLDSGQPTLYASSSHAEYTFYLGHAIPGCSVTLLRRSASLIRIYQCLLAIRLTSVLTSRLCPLSCSCRISHSPYAAASAALFNHGIGFHRGLDRAQGSIVLVACIMK